VKYWPKLTPERKKLLRKLMEMAINDPSMLMSYIPPYTNRTTTRVSLKGTSKE
jgi:hypothetical protein